MKDKIRLLTVGEEIKILLGKKKIPKGNKIFFARGSKKTNIAKIIDEINKGDKTNE